MNCRTLDETHDPALKSWVASANAPDTDFPIQNLPFGRFRGFDSSVWRIGVAIGDEVLDLHGTGLIEARDIRCLLQLGLHDRRELRKAISAGLAQGSPSESRWRSALLPMSGMEMGLAWDISEYTDFYAGIHHAANVGRLFRPDQPLMPNYKWMPIGYHGRASTIAPSGAAVRRPTGQLLIAPEQGAMLGPTKQLDFELELGIVVGQPNHGKPIPIEQAEDHVFGLVLLNDWSARDIQSWEYQPLGPFLSKNFATSISPWIVTMDALAPYRLPAARPANDPPLLRYLDGAADRAAGGIDIALEVKLQTKAMQATRQKGETISRAGFGQAAYWTIAQILAHHTVNGCRLRTGDLLGTGTLSGPQPDQCGSLLEMTQGGRQPIKVGRDEFRTFLQDGDAVAFTGRAERAGFAGIGFGECRGSVVEGFHPPTAAVVCQ